MLIFKEQISKFKSEFQIEYVLNVLVASVILIILVLSSVALYRPISATEYQQVVFLSYQESYPKTQYMAMLLTKQDTIRSADYYRLIYAKHYEASKIKQYPGSTMDGK